ncbi:MAG: hydrogenase expression/formation protein HypE [Faecalibacterium sp.]|jgi:hydrogenase expression/formation protein HypE|nr:hydrogenase expression/formation protein HypE [Faecalibacterium sp.]
MDEIVTLDYGSGGKKTSELIEKLMVPAFSNPALAALGDGAVLPEMKGELAFSTDSFVVDPIFFPGGNIGKLAVCGTVNDLAMCGAVPRYLSLGAVIEEGLPMADLEKIIHSIAETAARAGVRVVTGDTKVVERGRGDKIYLNTAGIGVVKYPGLSPAAIRPGDKVLLSGTAGDHGTAIMLARSELGLESSLQSDCMPLHALAAAACEAGGVHVLRDPTRGGVATTLNEFCEGQNFGIELEEAAVPVREDVRAACELLGLDALYCANEGKLLAVVSPERADAVLAALRATPGGENAAVIGTVTERWPGRVALHTAFGGSRVLTKLAGAQLPRIC